MSLHASLLQHVSFHLLPPVFLKRPPTLPRHELAGLLANPTRLHYNPLALHFSEGKETWHWTPNDLDRPLYPTTSLQNNFIRVGKDEFPCEPAGTAARGQSVAGIKVDEGCQARARAHAVGVFLNLTEPLDYITLF